MLKRKERDKFETDVELTKRKGLNPYTMIGADTFNELVSKSTIFVDKSLLIREFLNDAKVILITYPRRWGKTINMNMIKTFLELEINKEGKVLSEEQKINVDIFAKGIKTLRGGKPLAIWNEKTIVDKYFGKYPVISISFKELGGNNYDELLDEVKELIGELYKKHKYLLSNLNASESKVIQQYITQNVTLAQLKKSLKYLSEYIYDYYNEKVFILIDEYDSPINYAAMHYTKDEVDTTLNLFRGILGNGLKENHYLEKGFVTGILRIAKASLFSGINNLEEYNILDSRYSGYYGFTEYEVKRLTNQYAVSDNTVEIVQKWYNGYSIGDYKIYNPWSVLKVLARCIQSKEFDNSFLRSYWEESGTINFTKNLFLKKNVKKAAQKLINGESLSIDVIQQFTMDDFMRIKELIQLSSNKEVKEDAKNLIFSYLLFAGYLTPVGKLGRFILPNKEIKTEMASKIREYYDTKYSIDGDLFDKVTDELQKILDSEQSRRSNSLFEEFRKSFANLIEKMPEFGKIRDNDINSKTENPVIHANEDIVHSLLNYIVLRLNNLHKFGSEVYLGKGRADIIFISEDKGVIIELKYDGDATEAVSQIITQKYADSLGPEIDQILLGLNVNKDKTVDISHNLNFTNMDTDIEVAGVTHSVDNSGF